MVTATFGLHDSVVVQQAVVALTRVVGIMLLEH